MKRFIKIGFRVIFALAILFSGAGIFIQAKNVQAEIASPVALRSGELPLNWSWVETFGHTSQPYPSDIQGNHIYRPGGLFIDTGGKAYLVENGGKRFWRLSSSFVPELTVPAGQSGKDDPFFGPTDVVRYNGFSWVIDGHHLVVLNDTGVIVQNFNNFENTDPKFNWLKGNGFDCANGLSFDEATGYLYVVQNCGSNNVIVLDVQWTTTGDLFPTGLALVDAFQVDGSYKPHIQVADLDDADGIEVYIASDNGVFRCMKSPDWQCAGFGSGVFQRARGIYYRQAEDALYITGAEDKNWNANGIKKCTFDGTCEWVVNNNDLQNTYVTLDDSQDLGMDADGNLYVTDASRSVVLKFPSGNYKTNSVVFGFLDAGYVTQEGYFNRPINALVDAQNNLYFGEDSGRRVVSLDASGAQRWVFGSPMQWHGNESTEICNPQGPMAIDPAGHLYVADRCAGRIAILDKDTGVFLSSFRQNNDPSGKTGFSGPAGVALSPSDRMFILDPDNNRVQEYRYLPYLGWVYFSTIGTPVTYPNPSTADGVLLNPTGMVLSGDNTVFISDRSNFNRVQKCTRSGVASKDWSCVNVVGTPDAWGNSNYMIGSPTGLALDAAGRLFVSDSNNNRIQVFDSTSGEFLASIGTGEWGAANTQLREPNGVALDAAGNVYVADSQNHRIQKFLPVAPAMEFVNQTGGFPLAVLKFGAYLYKSEGPRVLVYDLTDPTQPVKVGQSPVLPGNVNTIVAHDFGAAGKFAYVGLESGDVQVLDIGLPDAPELVGWAAVQGNWARVALDDTASNLFVAQNNPAVLIKYSLADPARPARIGPRWLNSNVEDLLIRGSKAYLSINNEVVEQNADDMKDGAQKLIYSGGYPRGMAIKGDVLYVADAKSGLYGVNLTSGAGAGSIALNPAPTTVNLAGDYAYLNSNDFTLVHVVKIDGTSLTQAGQLKNDTFHGGSNVLTTGVDGTGQPLVYLPFVKGLGTYRVDTTQNPAGFTLLDQEESGFATGWQVQSMGTTLYAVDLGVFKVYDISDPTAPVLQATLSSPDMGFSPFVVRQQGDKRILYVLTWEYNTSAATLKTYDITAVSGAITTPLDSVDLANSNSALAVEMVNGKLIALVTGQGYFDGATPTEGWHPGLLEAVDVTDPAAFVTLPSITLSESRITKIAIQGNYAFATEPWYEISSKDGQTRKGNGSLHVVDISGLAAATPVAPEEKANFGLSDPVSFDIDSATLFLTERRNGLSKMQIDTGVEPNTWTIEPLYRMQDSAEEIQVEKVDGQTYAWIASGSGIRILNISDPRQGKVVETNFTPTPSGTGGISMSADLPWVWLVSWNTGLSAWWAAPTMDQTAAGASSTLTSELDGVSYTFAGESLRLWHTPVFQGNLPTPPSGRLGINKAFEALAFDPATEEPVSLGGPYTLRINYDPSKLGKAVESTLRLYYWSGTAWVEEPSTLDTTGHVLEAHPDHFSMWSVMGTSEWKVFIPIIMH